MESNALLDNERKQAARHACLKPQRRTQFSTLLCSLPGLIDVLAVVESGKSRLFFFFDFPAKWLLMLFVERRVFFFLDKNKLKKKRSLVAFINKKSSWFFFFCAFCERSTRKQVLCSAVHFVVSFSPSVKKNRSVATTREDGRDASA